MDAGSFTQRVLRPGFFASRLPRSENDLNRAVPRAQARECDETHAHDFAALVGPEGWRRLPALIRARFACSSAVTDVTYQGAMQSVRCSLAGYLLAQICRLFGTPLAPYEGRDVPIEVRVHDDPQKGGVAWDRIYFFPGHAAITVTSTKVFADKNMLLECVGGGFGMRLKVFEQGRKLHFLSQSYFWRFAGLSFRLPDWLTPGVAHVVHSDLGEGWFRFEMTMRHRLLGETFYQDGTFKEKE